MANIDDIKKNQALELAQEAALLTAVGDVATAIAAENEALKALKQQVSDLQAQIANGVPVTPADLEAVNSNLVTSTDNITKATDALLAVVAPPTPPPPAPEPPPSV